MKKLVMMLVAAMLMLSCGSVVQAALQNPETFETYSPTSNFESVTDTGWGGFTTAADDSFEIVDGTDSPNTSQVLYMKSLNTTKAGASWVASLSPVTNPLQRTSVDMNLKATGVELDPVNGTATYIDGWVNYRNSQGQTPCFAYLRWQSTGTLAFIRAEGGNYFAIPGGTALAKDTWYTVELDYNMTDKKVRARLGPQGGTMNAWTDWVGWYSTTLPGGALNYHRVETISGVQYDNFSLTAIPEPATLVLLASGGVMMLIRRKRR